MLPAQRQASTSASGDASQWQQDLCSESLNRDVSRLQSHQLDQVHSCFLQSSSTLDECSYSGLRGSLQGATSRQLHMTGPWLLSTSKLAVCPVLQPSRNRPRGRHLVHCRASQLPKNKHYLSLTGSSGSSSDGSDTSTGALKKAPGSLRKKDFRKFVHFFRQASPYIEGHRDRTFVIVIPGEVGAQSDHTVYLLNA